MTYLPGTKREISIRGVDDTAASAFLRAVSIERGPIVKERRSDGRFDVVRLLSGRETPSRRRDDGDRGDGLALR